MAWVKGFLAVLTATLLLGHGVEIVIDMAPIVVGIVLIYGVMYVSELIEEHGEERLETALPTPPPAPLPADFTFDGVKAA